MSLLTRHIIFCILMSCMHSVVLAQSGFYIPQNSRIFFVGDTATIFSNVLNGGKLGVGKLAVVNFKGSHWENQAGSLITDESNSGDGVDGTGGWIRFMGDAQLQNIVGGYNAVTRSGTAFAKLELANPFGLSLSGSSTKVMNEMRLSNGLFYLGNNIMVVGNNNPGTISGYDSARYFVTAGQPGNGILLRENISMSDGLVVFPIGSKPHAYTPGAVQSISSTGDDYFMNVFDTVRAELGSGADLRDSSVNKIWEVGKLNRPGMDEAYIYLQHLIADEGTVFSSRRGGTYISHFNGTGWDSSFPQMVPAPGTLTTGPVMHNGGLNQRQTSGLIGQSSFFTKFTVVNIPLPVDTKVWLNAYRQDWKKVKVQWTTKPEIDQDYFVVQRRLSNESGFSNIDTIASKAPNGTSIHPLNYTITDDNTYAGISYYRLLLVNLHNEQAYSNMVTVRGKPGGFQLLLWPNPTTGRFLIGISGTAVVSTIVISDLLGRKVREEKVGERSIIEMQLYIPGTYMITFLGSTGELLETKKLIVQPY